MGFSTSNKNKVLDLLFGAEAFATPANFYVALSTTLPTDAGANVNEPSGYGYTRIAVANTPAKWDDAIGGEKANSDDIVWSAATALWGTVGWWCLYDAASGGTFHHWGTIQTPRVIDDGDVFRFMAGDLVIQLRSD